MKGKNIRAPERGSGTDSFILDLSQDIFAWLAKANILERNKAGDLALTLRAGEQQGTAQVESVIDGQEPAR